MAGVTTATHRWGYPSFATPENLLHTGMRGAGLLFLLCGVRRRSIHVYLVEHRTAVAMDFDMIAPTYFIYLFSFFIYYSLP